MKNSIDHKTTLPARLAQRCLAVATGLTLLSSAIAAPDGTDGDSARALQVYFDDLKGATYTGVSNARDDLLQNAFADAAARKDWIGEYEVDYNVLPEEEDTGYLIFTVLDWERSRTNFYSFGARAEYVDNDGTQHDLGVVRGQSSGISVITSRDAGEMFSEVAETAIRDALKTLKDTLQEPS